MIRDETLPGNSVFPVGVWREDTVEPSELRAVLNAGHLAPSVHNTQPWRFVLTAGGIEVHADNNRRLCRIDPEGRELVISCGAAILNMRVASAAIGRVMRVETLPDAAEPSHLATLTFGARTGIRLADAKLAAAIEQRHAHRRSFGAGGVPGSIVAVLSEQAAREGARLVRLDERQQRGIARLTRVAEVTLSADPQYRREMRSWTTSRSMPSEGVPVTAFGTRAAGSSDGPPMRDFAISMPWLERAAEHYPSEEWFVIVTDEDDTLDWITAGQAVERVLLTATAAGLGASFMTQALEVAPIRTQLARYLGVVGAPQVIIRVGRATPTRAAARRPLDQVVTVGSGVATLLLKRQQR